jgi:hypothetical protein
MKTCLKCQGEAPLNYQYILKKNKEQKGKTSPFQGWEPVRGGGHKERVNKGKCGGCILYSCMKIEK